MNNDKNLRHNFAVNMLDGSFFGLGLGFASLTAILPLFVSQMTDSAILIGLIPALRGMGWQLPQLLMANRVTQMKRFKPAVVLLTGGERIPYLGLAAIAWFLPSLNSQVALVLTFALVIFAALSSGVTSTSWQSMLAKIIPGRQLSTFFGMQAAAANLLLSIGAVVAAIIMERIAMPQSFAVCFLLACAAMAISWFWLAQTREEEHRPHVSAAPDAKTFWHNLWAILKRDGNFRWFLIGRMCSQLAVVGFSFYTVYAVRHYNVSASEASAMTAVFAASQIVANAGMGWFGDRWGNRAGMQVGLAAATASAFLAWLATSAVWFYFAFILAGVAVAAVWTIGMSMTIAFASPAERPAYIGLSNTLTAPSTILAPLFGGWLADTFGYSTTFSVSIIGGILAVMVFWVLVKNPTPEFDFYQRRA